MEEANEPERTLLPLFPLGTVLFPGLVLPLHVFEPRYRTLVQHLAELPASLPREFGVIAIRRGWEVGRVEGEQGERPTRRSPPARPCRCTRSAAQPRSAS